MSDLDKIITAYLTIRDAIDAEEKKANERKKVLVVKRQKLEKMLDDVLTASGSKSLKTDSGTVSRVAKTSVRTGDKGVLLDSMVKYIKDDEFDSLALYDIKPNKKAVIQYMKENNDALPPGVLYDSWTDLQVRRGK